jgi:hypothetical protein
VKTFKGVHDYMAVHGKIFLFMGEGSHKIKRKAEQMACESALIKFINLPININTQSTEESETIV